MWFKIIKWIFVEDHYELIDMMILLTWNVMKLSIILIISLFEMNDVNQIYDFINSKFFKNWWIWIIISFHTNLYEMI